MKPATKAGIDRALRSLAAPLSPAELKRVNESQGNPFSPDDPLYVKYKPFDPSRWKIPDRPLPPAYLDFLMWSDGGSFRKGKRWFDAFFPIAELRGNLLAYHLPQYMPDALPFAMDGGGSFYAFDMREEPVEEEYPVVLTAAGNLGWRDAGLISSTFYSACSGTGSPFEGD